MGYQIFSMLLPFVGIPILLGLLMASVYLLLRKHRIVLSVLCLPCVLLYGGVLVRDIVRRSGCYICTLPRPSALWMQVGLILGFGLLLVLQLRAVRRLESTEKKHNPYVKSDK